MKTILSLFFLGVSAYVTAQPITGSQLVDACIAQHDAKSNWAQLDFSINHTSEVEHDGETSLLLSSFRFNNAASTFDCRLNYKGHIYALATSPESCSSTLHPDNTGDPETAQDRFLGCEGAQFMRDYYGYLLGLPMKLKDPGTIIHDTPKLVKLEEVPCYEVKVSYDPLVGDETWLFYIRQDNYGLYAARFYKDQETKQGELIYYRGYHKVDGVLIPKGFEWIVMPEETFLANDRFELLD